MFNKRTLYKVFFIVAFLGVLALAAVAPTAARAFFANHGETGFISRWLGAEPLKGVQRSIDFLAAGKPAGISQSADASLNSSHEGQYTLVGTLTAKNGDTWTVEGVTVLVSGDTQMSGTLEIGSMIKVEGILQADGSITALRIEPVLVEPPAPGSGTPPVGNSIELTGLLNSMDGTSWDVNGVTVVISDTTEISGTLQVGMMVKVEGTLQDDGSVLAREIKSAEATGTAGAHIEFTGALTSMEGTTWVVNGITVMVSDTTEMKGTLQTGMLVKVEGVLQADGSVLASEIEPALDGEDAEEHEGEDGDDQGENEDGEHQDGEDHEDENEDNQDHEDGQEVEFSGTLTAMSAGSWTIDGKVVTVSSDTELKGTFKLGAMVKVEGQMLSDGSFVAHEIKLLADSGTSFQNGGDDDHDDGEHWSSNSGSTSSEQSGSNSGSHDNDDDDDHDGGGEHDD